MAKQAQHLIDLSLSKITQSRYERRQSLHKNLLVSTVLQKAKCMFMEEIGHVLGRYQFIELFQPMWNGNVNGDNSIIQKTDLDDDLEQEQQEQINLQQQSSQPQQTSVIKMTSSTEITPSVNVNNCDIDKENEPPILTNDISTNSPNELIYFDLDKNQLQKWQRNSLKRRKECEQQQNQQQLPSQHQRINDDQYNEDDDDDDDNVIIRKRLRSESSESLTIPQMPLITQSSSADLVTSPINTQIITDDDDCNQQTIPPDSPGRVEIERITSLVSIFNFSGLTKTEQNCSTQVTDRRETTDSIIGQRTTSYLAMTAV